MVSLRLSWAPAYSENVSEECSLGPRGGFGSVEKLQGTQAGRSFRRKLRVPSSWLPKDPFWTFSKELSQQLHLLQVLRKASMLLSGPCLSEYLLWVWECSAWKKCVSHFTCVTMIIIVFLSGNLRKSKKPKITEYLVSSFLFLPSF